MENGKIQNLAEKIALLLQESEKGSDDFSLLRESLEKINQRLDKIESQIASQNLNSEPQIPSFRTLHASQEKFSILEELADEIIAGLQNEKACPYEPTAKPCDNCSMCSSRGF
jgi:hypothetical protein